MRKKLIVWMTLVGAMVMLIACGGKYADAEKVYTEFVDAMENYLIDMEKADDADAVAEAVNAFADEMEALAPRLTEINAKYPELKKPGNIPEKLKPIKERSDKMAKQIPGTFLKAMQYSQEAAVGAAFQRLGKTMASMGK